ncbi:unnamed protein product [Musa hybrid cultivar]
MQSGYTTLLDVNRAVLSIAFSHTSTAAMLREQWGDESDADGGEEVGDGEGDGGPHRGLAGGRPGDHTAILARGLRRLRLRLAQPFSLLKRQHKGQKNLCQCQN